MPHMLAVAILGVAVLTGCLSGASALSTPMAVELTVAGHVRSDLAREADPPGTEAVVIEPLEQITGSERVVIGAVGLDLPAGWTAEHEDLEHGSAARLFDGQTQVGLVSSTGEGSADAYAVQRALDGASESWGDLALRLRRLPVVWSGMPDAGALVFSFTNTSAGGAEMDALVVAAHATGQSGLVVVLVMAPSGTLDASPAYDVMRTIRFEGGDGRSTVGTGIYESSYAIGAMTSTLVILALVTWWIVWGIRRVRRKPAPPGAATHTPAPSPDPTPTPSTAPTPRGRGRHP